MLASPHPLPPEKKCINCVFHFPWVFQSRTVNVFQALYQTSQTIKMNFKKLLGFRTRFLKAKLQSVLISLTLVHPCPPSAEIQWICYSKMFVLEAIFAG